MTTFNVLVTIVLPSGRKETLSFEILAHLSESLEQRLIDPAFYELRPSGDVPQGQHYEMEIIRPAAADYGSFGIRHVHSMVTGRRFICYLADVPTLVAAEEVIHLWCVGAAYTKLTGKDFDAEYELDPSTFVERLAALGISAEITRARVTH